MSDYWGCPKCGHLTLRIEDKNGRVNVSTCEHDKCDYFDKGVPESVVENGDMADGYKIHVESDSGFYPCGATNPHRTSADPSEVTCHLCRKHVEWMARR